MMFGMTTRRTPILIVALCLPGCATTEQPEQRIKVRLETPFEFTDPCPKLATILAFTALFGNFGMSPNPDDEHLNRLKTELAARCPADVDPEPESVSVVIDFPVMACAQLDAMLSTLSVSGGTLVLPRDQRIVAEWLIDKLNAEIDRRCAP